MDLLLAWPLHGAPELGSELVAAYEHPDRRYHDTRHLADVLERIHELAAHLPDLDALAVVLAAWFHDAVYDPTAAPGANEAASAALAIQYLAMLDVDEARADEVARLVRLTAGHDPTANDRNGCLLADADLAILASDEPVYDAYATAVRREYHHLPAPLYRAGRIRVLDHLLALPQLYRIVPAWSEWTGSAHGNLRRERARLLSAPPD
jgi:predicted metal-dependent HD superfamily phosphohydrolase